MRKTQKSIKRAIELTESKYGLNIRTKKGTSLSREDRDELERNIIFTGMPWYAYISLVVGHREISCIHGANKEPTAVRGALASLMFKYSDEATVYDVLRRICDAFCDGMTKFK